MRIVASFREGLGKLSTIVHGALSGTLRQEGSLVARQPVLVIIASLLVMTIFSTLAVIQFHEDRDPEHLYAPNGAQSVKDRSYVREVYGYPSVLDRIYVIANTGMEENLLKEDGARDNLLEMMHLWQEIANTGIVSFGFQINYSDICYKPRIGSPCKVESILDAWNYDEEQLRNDPDVLTTINSGNITDAFSLPIEMDVALGGIERDLGGRITGAKIFQLALEIDTNWDAVDQLSVDLGQSTRLFTDDQLKGLAKAKEYIDRGADPRGLLWEAELVDKVHGWHEKQDGRLQAFFSSTPAVDRESRGAVRKDVGWVLLAVPLVGVYSLSMLFRNNWVDIKSHLVPVSIFAVVMSLASAFGFSLTVGVNYNLVVSAVPFVLLGLGVDDTFVILGAFGNTDRNKAVDERIADTMATAGPAIFVTSLTNFVAFLLTLFTDLPALQAFAIYSSAGIFFTFLFQVTFVLAFITLEARRELRMLEGIPNLGFGRKPALLIMSSGESNYDDKSTKSVQLCASEASTVSHTRKPLQDQEEESHRKIFIENSSSANVLKNKIFGKGEYKGDQISLTRRTIGVYLPSKTLSNVGKVLVVVSELLLLAAGVYGWTNADMDFRFKEWFTPDGSRIKTSISIEDEYFDGDQNRFSVFTKTAPDGSSYFDHQDDFADLMSAIRQNMFVAEKPQVHGWYDDFSIWLVGNKPAEDLVNSRAPNSTAFITWLDEFLNLTNEGTFYSGDVKFNEDRTEIVASRLLRGFSKDLVDGHYSVDFVKSVRATATAAAPDLGPIAYHFMFPFFDGLSVVQYVTVRNVLLAGAAVFVIVTLTLANVTAAAAVTVMVALTDTLLFGFMWYVGLTFNTVTAITLVLAVGIAVDYSSHVAYAFMEATSGSATDRARAALNHIGPEVFAGGMTTLLAVLPLGFGKHYITDVFFEMLTAIVVLGLWHGLVVLPVVLSLLQPSPFGGKTAQEDNEPLREGDSDKVEVGIPSEEMD